MSAEPDLTADELAELERELGQIDLRCYTPGHLANYVDGWRYYEHMAVIQDVWLRLWAGEFNRLIIQCPPQHGKSLYIAGATIPWALGVDPSLRVALLSYSASVAKKWGEKALNLFKNTGPELFRLQVSPSKRAKDDWEIQGHRGGMLTRGVEGSLTGEPVDYGVIDDYIKNAKQALSLSQRDAIWNWYVTVMLTRLSKRAKVVIMNTRWNMDDLAGRLIQQDKDGNGENWMVLNLPAIAPFPADVPTESHGLFFPDPLGRAPGMPLCAALHPLQKLVHLKKTQGEQWFWAMCQGLPMLGTGSFVKEENFRNWQWGELPVSWDARKACFWYPDGRRRFDDMILSVDCKYAKNNGAAGSYVVLQVWGRWGQRKFLLDEVRERYGVEETIDAIRKLVKKWPMIGAKVVEAKANGPYICKRLKDEIPGMIPWPVDGDKLARALAKVHHWFSGLVYIPARDLFGWVFEHIKELCQFPNGIYNDRVDAAVQAMDWFDTRTGGGEALRADKASVKDDL